ncbi:hypothetical protein [Brevibacillus sp. SYSU BS000544]|uniref:hypothetical protein n=1 Tax=Brevibacillus sp. SYSU BS000544 TaxID=3416443 RepID=UPI003CE4893E
MMQTILLFLNAAFVFIAGTSLLLWFHSTPSKPLPVINHVWSMWKQMIDTHSDDKWNRMLRSAGKPFGWGKSEWVAIQWILGVMMFGFAQGAFVLSKASTFAIVWMVLFSGVGFLLPYLVIKWWASYREDVLSVDIARFINRYITLLENHVPPYAAMVKAARPTRLLKNYVPSLSEWNRDKMEALNQFKDDLGVDDAIILVSNMRTIEQLSSEVISHSMEQIEWMIDRRRMFRHRKKIKSLGLGYSIIVYPAFYIGLIVAMFPWYKLLTEILDKYLV